MANDLESALRGVRKDASKFRAMVKAVLRQGWRVEVSRHNHIKFYAPNGKDMIVASMTARTDNSVSKLRQQLRKAGAIL
jgi:transcriptional/translational regulatory protein YebC/TACO1